LSRGDALEQLSDSRLQVIFSVDLFNEGVDLPAIDTVMMLRPTESKILFLQQLGRGLRKADGKDKLVVLDFIGNHHSFLHKPQALLSIGASYRQLAAFARKLERQELILPEGCFISYDLALIDFLKSLDGDGVTKDYDALKETLGRRPSLAEFYRAGGNVQAVRRQYGGWFELVHEQHDLSAEEGQVISAHGDFLREVETTKMDKSYKMVLLEAFQELDGWQTPPTLLHLATKSWTVLQRRRTLLGDLPETMQTQAEEPPSTWLRYWQDNPVNAWVGGNRPQGSKSAFRRHAGTLSPAFDVIPDQRETLSSLVQELIDFRLAAYEVRKATTSDTPSNVVPFRRPTSDRIELPYFPDLKIACGHFKTGSAEATEHRRLGARYGRIDPARHFIARASGNSMNGGKNPIRDGDYLLLELISPSNAGSITGHTVAIERQDEAGDNQYLLRVVTKTRDGGYVLKANNPAYEDLPATEEMRTLARFKGIIDPLDLLIGERFMREDIPGLFGEIFNPGNWNAGHVVLEAKKAHILLVTLNKQGKAEDHRYLDHWIDEQSFHWQSQNSTTPTSKRGRELIEHQQRGIALHLFVREHKLEAGKAAPFEYCGPVRYVSHVGSEPMSVTLAVDR
jgi:phage repressor protein C with HTH and peptisase S24 domain